MSLSFCYRAWLIIDVEVMIPVIVLQMSEDIEEKNVWMNLCTLQSKLRSTRITLISLRMRCCLF